MRSRPPVRMVVLGGVLVALVLAGLVSRFASGSPDGLNRVAQQKGFASTASRHASDGSPFADYSTHGLGDGWLSGGLAGVVGTLVVLVLAVGLVTVLRRRSRSDEGADR